MLRVLGGEGHVHTELSQKPIESRIDQAWLICPDETNMSYARRAAVEEKNN